MTDDAILDDAILDDEISHKEPIKILAVCASDSLRGSLFQMTKEASHIKVQEGDYEDPSLSGIFEETSDIDMVILECRIVEAYSDFSIVARIRNQRPLMPILVSSLNTDPDFALMGYQEGASDFVPADISHSLLAAKITALYLFCGNSRLLELKNSQMVDTMSDLRVSQSDLKESQEKVMHLKQTKEIMDALHDGFFYITEEIKIGSMVSASCQRIFGKDISGASVAEALLFEEQKGLYVAACVGQIFEDVMPEEVGLSMLPKTVKTEKGRILDLSFSIGRSQDREKVEKVIVVACDVTEKHALKKEAEERQYNDRRLIDILKNRERFLFFVSDFKKDIASLSCCKSIEQLDRLLHTIKGNAGAFGFEKLARYVHDLESRLSKMAEDKKIKEVEAEIEMIESFVKMFIKEHAEILRISYASDHKEQFTIESQHLEVFRKIAGEASSDIKKKLEDALDNLKNRPVSLLVSGLENNVKEIAKKTKKKIKLLVEGDDIRIDPKILSPVLRNLTHAINNACDHGIEKPSLRVVEGKDEEGTIHLTFSQDEHHLLRVVVADDGRGIDRKAVGEKAVEKGLLSKDDLVKMDEKEIDNLIFEDGLSSASSVSQTSGRGVGMASLKAVVKELGGQVEIISTPQKGAKLVISVPKVRQILEVNSGPRIMVCEDEEDLRSLYVDMLSDAGYEIVAFENGLDGLLALSEQKYDLVITDLNMPGMKGDTLVEKIRQVRQDHVPILVVSAFLSDEVTEKLESLENVSILHKGFNILKLKTVVASVLEEFKMAG